MKSILQMMSKEELLELYHKPLIELVNQASKVHENHHTIGEVQVSNLVSIKTGGCSEDCAYCPQAARYHTDVKVHKLLEVDEVKKRLKKLRKQELLECAWELHGEKLEITETSTKSLTW